MSLRDFLSSDSPESSKRLIAFMFSCSMILSMWVAQLFGKVLPEWMFQGATYIVIALATGTVIESFGKFFQKQ